MPDSPSPDTRVMMKRLMSKPAPCFSGSESDGQGLAKGLVRKRSIGNRLKSDEEMAKEKARSGQETDTDMSVLDFHIASLGLGLKLDLDLDVSDWEETKRVLEEMDGLQRKSSMQRVKDSSDEAMGDKPTEKRTRNILRRRPSATHAQAYFARDQSASRPTRDSPANKNHDPQSPLHPTPRTATLAKHVTSPSSASTAFSSGIKRQFAPQPSPRHSPSFHPSVAASGSTSNSTPTLTPIYASMSRASPTNLELPVLDRSGSNSAASSRRTSPTRERGTARDKDREPPREKSTVKKALTPAGELVEAYKRQVEAREAASRSASSHPPELSSPSSHIKRSPSESSFLSRKIKDSDRPHRNRTRQESRLLSVDKQIYTSSSANTSMSALGALMSSSSEGRTGVPGGGFDMIQKYLLGDQPVSQDELIKVESPQATNTPEPKQNIDNSLQEEVNLTSRSRGHHVPNAKLTTQSTATADLEVDKDLEAEKASAPYYTVFGSTSGRVVAVGGPDDIWGNINHWEAGVFGKSGTVSVGHDSEKESSGKEKSGAFAITRTISRKMSGHWRKGTEEEDLPRGRPSFQEHDKRKSTEDRNVKKNSRSFRLSIDKLARVEPVAKDDFTNMDREFGKVGKAQKSETLPSSSGGNKIWRLVKRISTSGLREKYHPSLDKPPPVPALPRNYISSPNQSLHKQPSNISSAGHSPTVLSRFTPSLSNSPHSISRTPSTTANVPPTTPPVASAPHAQGRPSTTTRSSSPISSDVASEHFFQGTQSARSSTSSYGDEVPPPLPKPPLGQHIIPPSELNGLLQEDYAQIPRITAKVFHGMPSVDRQGDGDWTIAPSPSVELPSLPFPPRRPHTSSGLVGRGHTSIRDEPALKLNTQQNKEEFLPESPSIPAFSTIDAINTFSPKTPPSKTSPDSANPSIAVPLTSLPPPPRPMRTLRKSSPQRMSPLPSPVHEPMGRKSESQAHNRCSSSAVSYASTARPRRQSALDEPSGWGSPGGRRSTSSRPAVFRELGSEKQALSEREKAEKWDDLLMRSAQAGGTLHIGGGEDHLMSDELRFSMVSDVTSS